MFRAQLMYMSCTSDRCQDFNFVAKRWDCTGENFWLCREECEMHVGHDFGELGASGLFVFFLEISILFKPNVKQLRDEVL
jgi:hypothetical protein